MPTYEYRCTQCGNHTEKMQSIKAEPLKTCPTCGKEALLRGPGGGIGLTFQGSGFYINDYKKKLPAEKKTTTNSCCPCGKKETCSSD